jgi:hypothetical protein
MIERLKRYPYAVLLAGLMLMLLSGPLVAFLGIGRGALAVDVMNVLVFLFGLWSVARSRAAVHAAWILCALSLIAIAIVHTMGHGQFRGFAMLFMLIFFVWVLLMITKDIILGGDVTVNRLIGAINVYLLLGLVWAICCSFVYMYDPDSFTGLRFAAQADEHLLLEFMYYSFVTLTTLGYGDIAPVTSLSRTLAYLEAAIGQVYLTFLVAGLVGVHLAGRQSREGR